MIKLYLKQAWQLLKQSRLFTTIYIVGVGLTITMVMTIAIIGYIKIGNIYPELNRDRTMVVRYLMDKSLDNGSTYGSGLSYKAVNEFFYNLETPESVTAITYADDTRMFVELEDKRLIAVSTKGTDAFFWNVFSFSFLDGRPYSVEEWKSAIRQVVINESLSKKVFGTVEAAGKNIIINFSEYKVCGVVKDASFSTPVSYAQVWFPYTCFSNYQTSFGEVEMLGAMEVYILLKNKNDAAALYDEVQERFHRYNTTLEDRMVDLVGQPELYRKNIFRVISNIEPVWTDLIYTGLLFLLLLLLVPAINLSGMISSRMEKRIAEFGIRKAFGASQKTLLNQILWENFLLTCLGGIAGLCFSWILIIAGKRWIINLFDPWSEAIPQDVSMQLMPEMLINPTIFMLTFCICMLLNLFSAIFPAWRALKRDIVDSLYDKN